MTTESIWALVAAASLIAFVISAVGNRILYGMLREADREHQTALDAIDRIATTVHVDPGSPHEVARAVADTIERITKPRAPVPPQRRKRQSQ